MKINVSVKSSLYLIALIILLAYIMLPIPPPWMQAGGMYNTFSRLSWCTSHYSCVHEEGHRLDQELGWPSASEKFIFNLQVYIVVNSQKEDKGLTSFILRFPGLMSAPPHAIGYDPRRELYATFYAAADGNLNLIPEEFRKFYLPGWKDK